MSVCENDPCVNTISFEAARVPSPSCKPVGTTVCLPGGRSRLHHALVHQVLELRTPRFETRRCWRSPGCWRCYRRWFPARSFRWRRYIMLESYTWFLLVRTGQLNLGYLLDGLLIHIRAHRRRLLQHLELPHDAHQTHRRFRRAAIRRLELALLDAYCPRGLSPSRQGRPREIVVALLGQAGAAGEIGNPQLADDLSVLRHRSIARNFYRLFARNRYGSRRALHSVSFGADQLAARIQAEVSIARIQRTAAGPAR